jgi:hypothetical protein
VRPDLGYLRRGFVRGLVITGDRVTHQDRNQQVPPLGAVSFLVVEQALPATEPSGRGAHLPAQHQVVSDPVHAVHGPRGVAGIEVGVMRTFESADVFVVAPQHVGRRREQLELLRPQGRCVVGSRQGLEGIRPGSPREGLTTPQDALVLLHATQSNREATRRSVELPLFEPTGSRN